MSIPYAARWLGAGFAWTLLAPGGMVGAAAPGPRTASHPSGGRLSPRPAALRVRGRGRLRGRAARRAQARVRCLAALLGGATESLPRRGGRSRGSGDPGRLRRARALGCGPWPERLRPGGLPDRPKTERSTMRGADRSAAGRTTVVVAPVKPAPGAVGGWQLGSLERAADSAASHRAGWPRARKLRANAGHSATRRARTGRRTARIGRRTARISGKTRSTTSTGCGLAPGTTCGCTTPTTSGRVWPWSASEARSRRRLSMRCGRTAAAR